MGTTHFWPHGQDDQYSGAIIKMEEGRNSFKILTGTPTGNRPLGRTRRRWEDNMIMDVQGKGINTRN